MNSSLYRNMTRLTVIKRDAPSLSSSVYAYAIKSKYSDYIFGYVFRYYGGWVHNVISPNTKDYNGQEIFSSRDNAWYDFVVNYVDQQSTGA